MKNKTNKKRKYPQSFYDFFYAFLITIVIDGAVILFVLSDFFMRS